MLDEDLRRQSGGYETDDFDEIEEKKQNMKKIIIFLFMGILCVVNTHAQLNHFLPRTDAVMSILNQKYWFEGDTIIKNLRYTKIYRQYCASETECGDLEYYAAVREDTVAAKIYCLFPCSGFPWEDCSEKLLADFDVKIGDEVMVYSEWSPSQNPAIVESIDFIEIDGKYRKRINIKDKWHSSFDFPPDVWVEGIGSVVYGLFFPNNEGLVDVSNPVFLCLHENDQLIYQNPNYEICYKEPWKSPMERFYEQVYECQQNTGHSFHACEYYFLRGSSLPESFDEFERLVEECLSDNPNRQREDCEFYTVWRVWNWFVSLENTHQNSIRVFPNPANNSVFIESNDLAFFYTLYNSQGYLVKSGKITHSKIDISELSSNWYFLVLYDVDRKMLYRNKLIKH